MKKRKSLLLVIALLLVGVTGGIATLTYSRYLSNANGTATATVAPWKVQVNGNDIVTSNTFTMDDITWSTSQYIADGYIAPSRTGTFDIEIDPTGSKVAVKYDVNIDTTALASYSQINIKSVTVEATELTATDGVYSGTINLEDIDTPKTLTVTIEWTNADATNTSDTTIGSTVDSLAIPVTVTASQYLG